MGAMEWGDAAVSPVVSLEKGNGVSRGPCRSFLLSLGEKDLSMGIDRARQVLVRSVMDDDGTFVWLRLGRNPGAERIRELQNALQILRQSTIEMESMQREIVYACAVIIHFKEECDFNMRDKSATSGQDLRVDLDALAQAAFLVLAGKMA
jgi:hypothetical protein